MMGLTSRVPSVLAPVAWRDHSAITPPLAPLTGEHAPEVRRLLAAPLAALYPSSALWLTLKLRDVAVRAAWGYGAFDAAGTLVGVMLASAKPHGPVKINTLYVSDVARHAGVGTSLIAAAVATVDQLNKPECYITVAHHLAGELETVLLPIGFAKTAQVEDRYGVGRHEVVYTRVTPSTPATRGMRRCSAGCLQPTDR